MTFKIRNMRKRYIKFSFKHSLHSIELLQYDKVNVLISAPVHNSAPL